jgi:hypothetical protein
MYGNRIGKNVLSFVHVLLEHVKLQMAAMGIFFLEPSVGRRLKATEYMSTVVRPSQI